LGTSSDRDTITRLLREVRSLEDVGERNRLFAAVYEELRRMARNMMRGERSDHTLRPTALVHEAFVRLLEQDRPAWESRVHFFGIAARAMRQVLVDHARERDAQKRGRGWQRVTLDEALEAGPARGCEILDLDAALTKLGSLDARAARVAEMRAFGGMTVSEVAQALGVSPRTVDDDWAMARLWLSRELGGPAA
jgi:RNA polymerase sigma factor (TIGR02999 family)